MNEGKIYGYGKAKDWQTKKTEAKPKNISLGEYLDIDWV